MENNEIKEGNKLIAEFMGFEYNRSLPGHGGEIIMTLTISDCRYHTSWDWIMPVVEKIEKQGCIVEIWLSGGKGCRIQKVETKIKSWHTAIESNSTIEAVWNAVIEYINFYNTNKSN